MNMTFSILLVGPYFGVGPGQLLYLPHGKSGSE